MLAAERGAAANTLEAYRRDLEDYLGYLAEAGTDPLSAESATVRGFLASLEERGLKPAPAPRRRPPPAGRAGLPREPRGAGPQGLLGRETALRRAPIPQVPLRRGL